MGIAESATAHMEETEIDGRQEMRLVHIAGKIAVKGIENHNVECHHVDRDHEKAHKIEGKVLKVDRREQTVLQRHLLERRINMLRQVSRRSQL